jgi:hypothetical protein
MRLRNFLLFTGALVLAGRPSLAAIAKVKDIGAAGNGPTQPSVSVQIVIPAGGVAAGNLLVVAIAEGGDATATATVTDTKGNTYTADATSAAWGTNRKTFIRSSRITTPLVATTDSITVTVTSPLNNGVSVAVSVTEFSGIAVSPLDKTASAVGTSTSPSSGATASTAQADELLVGAVGATGNYMVFTPGAGYSALAPGYAGSPHMLPEFRIVSATGTYSAGGTFSATDDWGAVVATYKDNACAVDAQNPTVTAPANAKVTQTTCN